MNFVTVTRLLLAYWYRRQTGGGNEPGAAIDRIQQQISLMSTITSERQEE